MASSSTILRDISEENDILFITAEFFDDSVYIGTNFTSLELLKEVKQRKISFSTKQRRIIQKFLNKCFPEDI